MDRAAREIEAALRLASEAPLSRSQKRATTQDLQRALESVTRVRYFAPAPAERESYEEWKTRRDQKRQARAEAQAAKSAAVKEQADV